MKKIFLPFISVIYLSFLSPTLLLSQSFDWAHPLSGDDIMNNNEFGHLNILDSDNNLYNIGQIFGTSDMDPGAATFPLTLNGYENVYVQKLTPDGDFIWAIGFENIRVNDASIDVQNNIYITGNYYGVVDFDPSTSVYPMSGGAFDAFILKLDSSGNFIWAMDISDTTNTAAVMNLTTDFVGNIYLTGQLFDTTGDMDPGIGTTILYPTNPSEMWIMRMTTDGEFKWAHNLGANSVGNLISCGPDNQPVMTGSFGSVADFDLGPGTLQMTPIGFDNFILKIDSLGNGIWADQLSSELEYAEMTIDDKNDVYFTGGFYNFPDFDPGTGNTTLSSQGSYDIFIQKIQEDGTFDWAKSYGAMNPDIPTAISVDSSYSVFVGGYFNTVVDFDNGPGNAFQASLGMEDAFILKTDSQGDYVWVTALGGVKEDRVNAIVADKSGNVYASGFTEGIIDFDPSASIYNINTQSRDAFNIKIAVDRPDICMVTVDTASTHNIIYWDKSLMVNIDTIFVYRETTTNNYNIIASIPYDSSGQFIDTVSQLYFPYTGNPNMGTYRYKIQTKDRWGGVSQKSRYHNTIFAINIFGTFDWNDYLIEEQSSPIPQLGAYLLWRDDISDGNWHVVGAVAGTQTTITDPQYPNFPNGSWRVLTDWSISCDPTRAGVNTSRSNIKNSPNAVNTILENENFVFDIYPNPASEIIIIESENSFEKCTIRILDITGKEIQNLNSTDSKINVDVSDFASGVYFIRIETELGIHIEKVTVE